MTRRELRDFVETPIGLMYLLHVDSSEIPLLFLLFLVKIYVITIAEVAEKADHSRGDQLTKLTSAMVTS